MYHLFDILFLVPLCITPALADHVGAKYPQPVDLSSNKSTIPAAWRKLTWNLQKHLDAAGTNQTFGGLLGLENLTFSIGMFSLNDPAATDFQFHYISTEVAQGPSGTNEVDGDSIYRVASITKLFTVLTGLLELNSGDWDRSIAEVFPSITETARNTSERNAIDSIEWHRITLNTLASQISGLPTNPFGSDQLVQFFLAEEDPTAAGYPPLDINDFSEFGYYTNMSSYLPELALYRPNFLPWTSPIYSNNNFLLLTALMQKITGKDMPSMVTANILEPLGMGSSFSGDVPKSEWDRSVIIDPLEFTLPLGLAVGSGGLASTVNDLAKFGIGVLNSTLLPSQETRRWMKPTSHTGRFQFSFGRPWEILRYTQASGAVTDLYTKAGDSGTSSSYLVIVPEYNAGFTILCGSSLPERNALVGRIGDLLANTLLPAFGAQAAVEANRNFVGRYESTVDGLNSSLVLSINDTNGADPGLLIDSFIVNGTDIAEAFPLYYAAGARLTPSIDAQGDGLMAFRVATAGDAPSVDISQNLFSGSGLGDYLIGDAASYGGISLSLFVFEVDDGGNATTVSPAAWRTKLKRCN